MVGFTVMSSRVKTVLYVTGTMTEFVEDVPKYAHLRVSTTVVQFKICSSGLSTDEICNDY